MYVVTTFVVLVSQRQFSTQVDKEVLQYNLILQNRYTIKEKQLLIAKTDHQLISSVYEININISFKYICHLFSKSDVIWKI